MNDLTPEKKKAVQQVLLCIIMCGGKVKEFYNEKEAAGVLDIKFADHGWIYMDQQYYHITPKGIAFVEES